MFRRGSKRAENADSPGPGLRDMALRVEPATLGLDAATIGSIWGFVMDSSFADSDRWFTLATFAEGSTSLYTSGMFGVIGGGSHAEVRAASRDLLQLVAREIESFTPSEDISLPARGLVTLRALTFDGHKTITAPETILGRGGHPASPIFHAAHAVVTALRMT